MATAVLFPQSSIHPLTCQLLKPVVQVFLPKSNPTLPFPSEPVSQLRERASGKSRNPVFVFIHIFKILDAGFRRHDEL
jgi:hypothetical protein